MNIYLPYSVSTYGFEFGQLHRPPFPNTTSRASIVLTVPKLESFLDGSNQKCRLTSFSTPISYTESRQTSSHNSWSTPPGAAGLRLPDQPACSIDVISTTTPSGNVPSGRLKGRARKEAKIKITAEAAKAAEDTKANTTYRIKLSKFTKLTGVIIRASGSSVPDSVLKLAKQIVDLRKGFSRL